MHRFAIVICLVSAACEEHGSRGPDAAVDDAGNLLVDAAPVDAPKDIEMACAAACDKIATCVMEPPDGDCNRECSEDVADCTPQQILDVQNCALLACGTPQQSPVIQCLEAIPCINP